jgi:hypothetical protein
LATLLNTALSTPELCGFVKYFHRLDPEIREMYFFKESIRLRLSSAFFLLAHEEERVVLDPSTEIDGNEGFVFPIEGAEILQGPKSLDFVWQILDLYADGLLKHLDLSGMILTGSAITAAVGLIYHPHNIFQIVQKYYEDRSNFFIAEDRTPDFERDLKVYFPNLVTVPADYLRYREIIEHGGYRISQNKLILGKEHLELKSEEGADIDLAVLSENEEEFEELVQAQFRRLRKFNAQLKLVKVERKTLLYEIQGHTRKIQLYPSNLKQILTHHLAMVRGFVYGNDQERMMYCSASALYSFYERRSLNYYYFAGLKSPVEVILKYQQRGYYTQLPGKLRELIDRYQEETPKWSQKRSQPINDYIHHNGHYNFQANRYPAVFGYGNFDIHDLAREEQELKKETGSTFSEWIAKYEKSRPAASLAVSEEDE